MSPAQRGLTNSALAGANTLARPPGLLECPSEMKGLGDEFEYEKAC